MTLQFWIGLVLFLVGGALLALGGAKEGSTAVGTTFAIAGLGLLGWVWWRRQDQVRDDEDA